MHLAHVLCLPTFKKKRGVGILRRLLCARIPELGLRHAPVLYLQAKPPSVMWATWSLHIQGLSPVRGIGICPIASVWPSLGLDFIV